jgi:transposase-like protein
MSARRHRRHSTELKLRLVQAYLNGEGSFKSIAKQNDISHALLQVWVEKFRRGELTEEIDHSEKAREHEATIAALERKVGQLVMEIDLLKKLPQAASKPDGRVSIISGPVAYPSPKDADS